jgi:hypothetical protein
MNAKLKKTLACLGLCLLAPLAFAQHKTLSVNSTTQEHDNWCWAASSKAVIGFYKTPPSQCSIVNWAFGINYACGNSTFNWSSNANKPDYLYGAAGSVQDVLAHWGIGSNPFDSASSWNTIVSDINANKPFVIRFGWTSGGGHIMVGTGYHVANGTPYVNYMNPWPGEGNSEANYYWMVQASDHNWTHSLRVR